MVKHDNDRSINWEQLDGKLGASTDDLMVFTDENDASSGAILSMPKTTTSCCLGSNNSLLGYLLPDTKSSFHIFQDENERSGALPSIETTMAVPSCGEESGPYRHWSKEAQVSWSKLQVPLYPTVSEDLSLSANLLQRSLGVANQLNLELELNSSHSQQDQHRGEMVLLLPQRATEIQDRLGASDGPRSHMDAFGASPLGTDSHCRRDPMTRRYRHPCSNSKRVAEDIPAEGLTLSPRSTNCSPEKHDIQTAHRWNHQPKQSERRVSFQGDTIAQCESYETRSRRHSTNSTATSTCSSREPSHPCSSLSASHPTSDPAHSAATMLFSGRNDDGPLQSHPRTQLGCDLDATLYDILAHCCPLTVEDAAPRRPQRRGSFGSRSSSSVLNSPRAAVVRGVGSRPSPVGKGCGVRTTPLRWRIEEDGSDSNDFTMASDIMSMLSLPYE